MYSFSGLPVHISSNSHLFIFSPHDHKVEECKGHVLLTLLQCNGLCDQMQVC